MVRTSDLEFEKVVSSILARGTKIFVAPGKHSFSLFQEENIPWSICVLLTSSWIILFYWKYWLILASLIIILHFFCSRSNCMLQENDSQSCVRQTVSIIMYWQIMDADFHLLFNKMKDKLPTWISTLSENHRHWTLFFVSVWTNISKIKSQSAPCDFSTNS